MHELLFQGGDPLAHPHHVNVVGWADEIVERNSPERGRCARVVSRMNSAWPSANVKPQASFCGWPGHHNDDLRIGFLQVHLRNRRPELYQPRPPFQTDLPIALPLPHCARRKNFPAPVGDTG